MPANIDDNQILSRLELICKRNMLKWHVGQVMFCPRCGRIMDCKRAVECDLYDKADPSANSRVKSYIYCASCWDTDFADLSDIAAKSSKYRMEVTDGRVLFARPKQRKV